MIMCISPSRPTRIFRRAIGVVLWAVVLTWVAIPHYAPLRAQAVMAEAPDLKGIDVIEHLGETIPLDLHFLNSDGDTVALSDYFQQGIPVILTLHYTNCPMLCSLVLNGLSTAVNSLSWMPGKEFEMVSVSIDPRDTPLQASALKERYSASLKHASGERPWAFLVGQKAQIDSLAEALGFEYYYVQKTGEYAHPALVFILTENGRISCYLYGIQYKERDLHLALLEASEGKIGSTIDRLILYCYHYDPEAGGYVAMAANIMKLGGVLTLIVLGLLLGILWGRERIRKRTA